MRRISLFGVPVNVDPPAAILETIIERALEKVPTRIYYVNAHVLNLAMDDPAFKARLCSADFVLADGYGARLAARWLKEPEPERFAITDYIWDFARICSERGATIFIAAGQPGVAERARLVLERRYPQLRVVGTHHGFVTKDRAAADVLREVAEAKPDILCVGMGSPLQEEWVERHRESIDVPVVFAVGAVMDYVSGQVQRSRPQWMSDRGLEWVGRLFAEPRRMWRRYLLGNPRFVFRTVRERLRRRAGRTSA